MKYVIEWHPHNGGSAQENLMSSKRSLEVLSKWSPATTMHQFVARLDPGHGYAVVESDDPAAVAKDAAIFAPFLEVSVHEVMDMQDSVGALQQAIDFTEHA